jgi:glycerophosphoryl diester phosphodiesterase
MNKKRVIKHINPLFLKGIAHRGLHDDKLTENGLKAFKKAIDNNFAFELDVHLTTDNELIVCHDSELKRTTGKEGIIEHLSLKEIKNNYKLLDGEDVPTLKEVFALDHEKVPIVVELKVYEKNYKALAKETLKELKLIKDKRNIIVISFDPRALLFMGHRYIRQLLVTTNKNNEIFWTFKLRYFFESLDMDSELMNNPKVIKYSKNHFINVWTIDSKNKFDKVFPYINTTTFQLMDNDYVRENLTTKNKKYL